MLWRTSLSIAAAIKPEAWACSLAPDYRISSQLWRSLAPGMMRSDGSPSVWVVPSLKLLPQKRWLTFLRQAIPGCTELEAQWLVSRPSPVDSPLPAPQNQNKRRASHSGGSEPRHMKRSAAGPSTPVRCSPRYHHTPMPEPTVVQDTEAPSPLAASASHQSHRPQLSQAFSRLYGTGRHKGILAGLAILKLYCECLGTTW